MKLLSRVEEELKDLGIKDIKQAKILSIFRNPLRMNEILIEYIIRCELGEISIKILVSNNPKALLRMYYEYETSGIT